MASSNREPQSLPWREAWYPIAFYEDVAQDRPSRVVVQDHAFVLFLDSKGAPAVLDDACPHRRARLSDGCVRDGSVECPYHGWRFAESGHCLDIPQLPHDRPIPTKAHTRRYPTQEHQGIVWLWPSAIPPEPHQVPPALDRLDGCRTIDFTIELPYAQGWLVENVVDVAHIHIAHAGVRGGGLRHMAGPIDFEIEPLGVAGLAARFRSSTAPPSKTLKGAHIEFKAPTLVHYRSDCIDPDQVSGLALYCVPVDQVTSRLLYRAYNNYPTLRERLRPRWLEHQFQCKLLEQDLDVVMGQAADLNRDPTALRASWLPLTTSDPLVVAYRRWIDQYAQDWPSKRGFDEVPTLRSESLANEQLLSPTRAVMHGAHCGSCRRAGEWAERAARIGGWIWPLALIGAALSALTDRVAFGTGAITVSIIGFLTCRFGERTLDALHGRGNT